MSSRIEDHLSSGDCRYYHGTAIAPLCSWYGVYVLLVEHWTRPRQAAERGESLVLKRAHDHFPLPQLNNFSENRTTRVMYITRAVLCLGLSLVVADSITSNQQPLDGGYDYDLIRELKIAEIIPTVFDEFKPFLTLNVTWAKATAEVGNTIKVKKVQKVPKVQFFGHLPGFQVLGSNEVPQLTLALTDPDARSRENPDWSQMCHWIVTNVSLTDTSGEFAQDGLKHAQEIVSYQPPGPPKKTGKHRYVFAALAPKNGTSANLHLSTPKSRQHWGYGAVRAGLREWAEENGLEVVGANFIYAQDKKQ